MSLASIMQLKKIEVPLTEANFRVLLQPLCREGLGVGLVGSLVCVVDLLSFIISDSTNL